MNPDFYGLIEMTFSFGLVLALCVWQLRALEKTKRRMREDAAARNVKRAD